MRSFSTTLRLLVLLLFFSASLTVSWAQQCPLDSGQVMPQGYLMPEGDTAMISLDIVPQAGVDYVLCKDGVHTDRVLSGDTTDSLMWEVMEYGAYTVVAQQDSCEQAMIGGCLVQSNASSCPCGGPLAVKEATMTDSDGNTRKTTYRHPTDFRGAEQDKFGSNHLRDQHMHQVVLEQESLVNTDVVQRTERSYALSSDLVVPAWQKVYPEGSGQAWSTLFAHDAKGNLVQATQLGGAAGDYPTSYLYGYEETLPIATVEGATYGTVRNTFSASDFTRLQQDYLSDETLRSKLAPLRRISGSLATLYTYDPLVGRTSEVAPNGLVTYYEYDARNRLRFMLNHERKYTGQYQYHYRGEAQPQ